MIEQEEWRQFGARLDGLYPIASDDDLFEEQPRHPVLLLGSRGVLACRDIGEQRRQRPQVRATATVAQIQHGKLLLRALPLGEIRLF